MAALESNAGTLTATASSNEAHDASNDTSELLSPRRQASKDRLLAAQKASALVAARRASKEARALVALDAQMAAAAAGGGVAAVEVAANTASPAPADVASSHSPAEAVENTTGASVHSAAAVPETATTRTLEPTVLSPGSVGPSTSRRRRSLSPKLAARMASFTGNSSSSSSSSSSTSGSGSNGRSRSTGSGSVRSCSSNTNISQQIPPAPHPRGSGRSAAAGDAPSSGASVTAAASAIGASSVHAGHELSPRYDSRNMGATSTVELQQTHPPSLQMPPPPQQNAGSQVLPPAPAPAPQSTSPSSVLMRAASSAARFTRRGRSASTSAVAAGAGGGGSRRSSASDNQQQSSNDIHTRNTSSSSAASSSRWWPSASGVWRQQRQRSSPPVTPSDASSSPLSASSPDSAYASPRSEPPPAPSSSSSFSSPQSSTSFSPSERRPFERTFPQDANNNTTAVRRPPWALALSATAPSHVDEVVPASTAGVVTATPNADTMIATTTGSGQSLAALQSADDGSNTDGTAALPVEADSISSSIMNQQQAPRHRRMVWPTPTPPFSASLADRVASSPTVPSAAAPAGNASAQPSIFNLLSRVFPSLKFLRRLVALLLTLVLLAYLGAASMVWCPALHSVVLGCFQAPPWFLELMDDNDKNVWLRYGSLQLSGSNVNENEPSSGAVHVGMHSMFAGLPFARRLELTTHDGEPLWAWHALPAAENAQERAARVRLSGRKWLEPYTNSSNSTNSTKKNKDGSSRSSSRKRRSRVGDGKSSNDGVDSESAYFNAALSSHGPVVVFLQSHAKVG